MAGPNPEALAEGARNLLIGCGGLGPGMRVAIVAEDPALGWYDAAAPRAVAEEARRLGMAATIRPVGAPTDGPDPDSRALDAVELDVDAVVFFARLGDQDRFAGVGDVEVRIMSYARDAASLASPFGCAAHGALRALKEAVDSALCSAGEIEIVCPLGTRIAGHAPRLAGPPPDVTTRRFPLGVPAPVPAAAFSGRVALARWLTPTGNRAYAPATLTIGAPVIAEVEEGTLVDLRGDAGDVAAIKTHYARVGALFGGAPMAVHSWHAGIHPGCAYDRPAAENPDRWSNSAFSNPRILHFHTCGEIAPGEISWMVLDVTVTLDGAPLWRDGRLVPDGFPEIARACADPALAPLVADPAQAVGL